MSDPNYWGPALWTALHTISFNYPEQPTEKEQTQYRAFFQALKHVLPCGKCRLHYAQGIDHDLPLEPALRNRDTLSRWLVDFHNSVNRRLDKPIVTYDSVKEKYDALSGKCQNNVCTINVETTCDTATIQRRTHHLLYVNIVLLVLIIAIVIYYVPTHRV